MDGQYNFGVNIDKNLIENNVTALVANAIATALGDKEELVRKAVSQVLESYVDKDGKVVDKSSWKATPYLQYVATQCIEETVRAQMEQAIKDNAEELSNIIKKEISKPKFKSAVAASFINTMLSCAGNQYRMPITVQFEEQKDY